MSATWEGLSAEFKRQLVTKDLQESIKAFRVMGAKIELQAILNYPNSVELRELGSGSMPAVRQMIKTGDEDRTHHKSRLISRAAANVSRFL
jgi:hypothetical protein